MTIEIKPGQTHIKSKAMVAWAAGEPLKMEEVDVQLPKAGEVLVRIVATGVCHTDAFTLSSDCLLYTSPSPRDLDLSRMPSSA